MKTELTYILLARKNCHIKKYQIKAEDAGRNYGFSGKTKLLKEAL
jgi:hypothetical protein